LAPEILRDKKIRDADLQQAEEEMSQATRDALQASPCYSLKSLYGMPKVFQKALTALNRHNLNKTIGIKICQYHEGIEPEIKETATSNYLEYEGTEPAQSVSKFPDYSNSQPSDVGSEKGGSSTV